jgi:antitoxin HigA-1
MKTITRDRTAMHNPPHPGEILKELYLDPLEMTVTEAARRLGVSRKTLSKIVNGNAGVTANMAMRLGYSCATTPDLWINAQANYDLWHARKDVRPSDVEPLRQAG